MVISSWPGKSTVHSDYAIINDLSNRSRLSMTPTRVGYHSTLYVSWMKVMKLERPQAGWKT